MEFDDIDPTTQVYIVFNNLLNIEDTLCVIVALGS